MVSEALEPQRVEVQIGKMVFCFLVAAVLVLDGWLLHSYLSAAAPAPISQKIYYYPSQAIRLDGRLVNSSANILGASGIAAPKGPLALERFIAMDFPVVVVGVDPDSPVVTYYGQKSWDSTILFTSSYTVDAPSREGWFTASYRLTEEGAVTAVYHRIGLKTIGEVGIILIGIEAIALAISAFPLWGWTITTPKKKP